MAGRLKMLIGAVAVAAALDGAPALAADQPLVGRWQQFGGVVEYYATGANSFEARVIKPNTNACADKPADIKLKGSGLHYKGTIRYYNTGSCEFVGNGTLEITLASDGDSGDLATAPPGGAPSHYTITRDPGPLEGTGSLLPGTVYHAFLDLQVRYKQATRKKKLHKNLRDAARAYRRTVQRFPRPSDPADRHLKTCSSLALATVIKGTKLERSGRGLRELSRCFGPYRKADIVPKKDPGGHHYVGSSPKVPRLEFDVVDGKVTHIGLTLATKCGGKGYVRISGEDDFAVALDDAGRFEYTQGLIDPETGMTNGQSEHTSGSVGRLSASGKSEWTFDDPADSPDAGVTCTSGELKWTARL